ncbi:MAG TPA: thioredoxin domain-containing protein, partial [Candidatus Melainabacteria bacterium]|nr:thioredoxin domain-containing protein [Candidatus Melainabacteria bacterium]
MTETRKKNKTANRLVNETSTYLQQHAYNPVNWYPWGEEALTRAKEEERPILLSIGYAACHWCHVMEHESFEDEETAALMNAEFINIKVDREERTDLDEIYMKAVQLMTGHGGWPMTVFLTPQLKPIFAGTYFPPDDRHGMPSFRKILSGVSRAWKEKRVDVLKSADEVTEHLIKFESMGDLKSVLDLKSDAPDFDFGVLDRAFSLVYKYLDDAWGGIGSAPKFPQPFCLALAMRI